MKPDPLYIWYAMLLVAISLLSGACLATGGGLSDARG